MQPITLLAKSLQAFADVIRVDAKIETKKTVVHTININVINSVATTAELRLLRDLTQRVEQRQRDERAIPAEVVQ